MKIKYLVCYDTEMNKEQERAFAPSAATVVKSVLSTLKETGCDVEMVSFCSTRGSKRVPKTRYQTEEGFHIQLFESFGTGNLVKRVVNHFYMKLQYFLYLLFNIKKDEIVIAYHSPYHINILCFLKRIKKFRLVLQMLEIYSDVTGDKILRDKEFLLAEKADAYIFPTEILSGIVNKNQKPEVIMLGTYQVERNRGTKFDDGGIHVLYAGTLDSRKGGATAAALSARYLPEEYHVHILGFGSEEDKKELFRLIKENKQSCSAKITYDGLLSGENYIQFVQSCDIGLSTQNPDAAFNDTSFPSKILSYMANGLRVVSIRIPVVEKSIIGAHMYYYDYQKPENIARAIMEVNINDNYDSRKIIAELDAEFTKGIQELLKSQVCQ